MVKKKDIEELVIQHKKSTLKTHWNDSFFYNTTKYSGEIKPNEILLWRSSFYLRGAYPIYHLTFDENQKLNGIKALRNPYHILVNKIFVGLIIIPILLLLFTTEFKSALTGIFGVLFVLFLLNIILKRIRKYETKIITDELKEKIQEIENLNTI